MIFSIDDHIEQIIAGTKTQTRRIRGGEWYPRYQKGKLYKIQPGRGKKSILEGQLKIESAWIEYRNSTISEVNAEAEGGYSPEEFEALFLTMYPHWGGRWAYKFRFQEYET